MGLTLAQKIIKEHLSEGELKAGQEIAIKIDQTLTQDATGTMAYLQFEALGIKKVRTELSVSYVDHNMLQNSFENADDHRFLQSIAKKYGLYFSKPGNGICHQVHLERFGKPCKTLLGSDSHTPTGGGLCMIAIGAGGLDVACAMAGYPFYMIMPKITGINLTGRLNPFISAKDIILEVLRILSVKGGVGNIIEYFGEGVKTLSVPERATITNMGAELGATTSIFPSDLRTKEFLIAQGRGECYLEYAADPDASYDKVINLDLNKLEPMIACPHSPDNIKKVSELKGTKIDQSIVGSCTNSSVRDMMIAADLLEGRTIHPDVSFVVCPGSKQVLEMLSQSGHLAKIISSGARVLESGCGPCIGMGQAPKSGSASLRTFNRNFEGRSGTKDAKVYLVSPEVAVAGAVFGEIVSPDKLGKFPVVNLPEKYIINDNMIIRPYDKPDQVNIERGPNIKPLPKQEKLSDSLCGEVLLKTGDNITTDHIMPAGSKILPLRSNIPAISEYVFSQVDPNFVKRAKEKKQGFIVGGENYGQGSSREHAALAPMYLGIKAVIAKSFARIHRDNLVNFGIIPLIFADGNDYNKINQGDLIAIENIRDTLFNNRKNSVVENRTQNYKLNVTINLSQREIEIILSGGKLNFVKSKIN